MKNITYEIQDKIKIENAFIETNFQYLFMGLYKQFKNTNNNIWSFVYRHRIITPKMIVNCIKMMKTFNQYRFQNYVIDSINSLLPKDKKIQNCSVLNNSILCLDVQPIKNSTLVKFQLSLVYDGDENTAKEGKTYCHDIMKKMMETSYSVDEEKFNNTFKISKNDNTQKLKLFFVRHGFSEHNDTKTGKKNTSLLQPGIDASIYSGIKFNEMYRNSFRDWMRRWLFFKSIVCF